MTVRELIELLRRYDPDTPVLTNDSEYGYEPVTGFDEHPLVEHSGRYDEVWSDDLGDFDESDRFVNVLVVEP